ncbi:hypothetical protein MG296_14400 [Flavobacteriaceae bacterium TK19130]|nr:hypothetical protein [Thermobacterium salinum]
MKLPLIVLIIILVSCKVEESDLLDNARFEFENVIFESGIDHLKFNGPYKIDQIEDFEPDSEYAIYYWWTKVQKDSIRVYAKVHKELKKQTSIHFSKNYIELHEKMTRSQSF